VFETLGVLFDVGDSVYSKKRENGGLKAGHLCGEGHQPQEITTSARLHTDRRQAGGSHGTTLLMALYQLLLKKKFRGFPAMFINFICIP